MPRYAFLVNNDGYKKYTALEAVRAGASVPKIKDGIERIVFRIHNAEPLNRYFELPFKYVWFSKCLDKSKLDTDDDNIFVFYESFHMSYSKKLIRHIKKTYKKSKCIFMFTNPVDSYNLRRIQKISDCYDKIMTFNKEDAEEYGFSYCTADLFRLPQQDESAEIKSDLFFVGADKGRLDVLINIFEMATARGLVCDFWIVGVPEEKQKYSEHIHYNQRLTYEEVLKHDNETRCIVEVIQSGKQYSSIRTSEALQYKKKLLTMNESILNQWFYDPDIIRVFREGENIDLDFVREPINKQYCYVGSFESFSDQIEKMLLE